MKILYFAWLRERLNKGEDEFDVPNEVSNVSELIDWISANDEAAELAFADKNLIRAAVDEKLVEHDFSIIGAKTIAFFPPMTGG
jgi:molybdopterin synthase sulfur carrier subunit